MSPQSINLTSTLPSALTDNFTISANPKTDNWRTPPSTDRASAPIIYEPIPLATFKSAKVTVTAPFKALYDQAGLVLLLPQPAGSADERIRWIKAGCEVVGGVRNASVVAANPYSDWSLTPLDIAPDRFAEALQERGSVTIGFERAVDDAGKPKPAMWVSLELPGGKRQNLRELTWVFDQPEGREAWVGVYTARPIGLDGSDEPLHVEVKGFELKTF